MQTFLPGLMQGGSEASKTGPSPGAEDTRWPRGHQQFTKGWEHQKRAPPELACQQPIQGSSAAQRPEVVTRSLAWSRRQ